MELFELKNYRVVFAPQALALVPFKKLWDRDKSKDKTIAIAELASIYYFADYKSDFTDILDEHERIEEIKKYVNLPKNWAPDEAYKEAVSFYLERSETITTKLLRDARIGVDKLSKFLKEVDLNKEDKHGKPKYNAKQIGDSIKNLGDIVGALEKLDAQVKKEQRDNTLRGGRDKGYHAD